MTTNAAQDWCDLCRCKITHDLTRYKNLVLHPECAATLMALDGHPVTMALREKFVPEIEGKR